MGVEFMVDKNSLEVTPEEPSYYEGDRVILHCECWANIHITAPTPTIGFWSADFIAHTPAGTFKSTDHKDYSGFWTREKAVTDIDIGTYTEGILKGYVEVKCYHM